MFLNIVLLIFGFVILIKGADFFVDGASAVASNLKVSKMLIALTIVSFGTSAPELAVGIKAIAAGNGDIVLGNVIGSNTLNILLIVGVSAVVHSLSVKNNTVKKELPITMLITTLFGVLLLDNIFDKGIVNNFSRSDGIVLLLFFSVFMYYLISMSRNKIDEDEVAPMSMIKAIGLAVLGLVGIILGSNFVVDSATFLAKAIGVSERIVSLTVIAFGTSLPELVTSVSATVKGEYDIAIGNVVGSNIFNIGIVLGIPVTVFGGIGRINFSLVDIAVMVITAVLLFIFSANDRKITKSEGIIFLIIFVLYYGYILMS